jgi:hypothetical protein
MMASMRSLSPASASPSQNLLAQRGFVFYLGARSFSEYSYQIATVAIGWQIYDLTGSALDLGIVGLVQFVPSALLVFVAGHAADRYDRKRVAQLCQIAEGLVAALLAWGSFAGWLTVPEIFAALAILGAPPHLKFRQAPRCYPAWCRKARCKKPPRFPPAPSRPPRSAARRSAASPMRLRPARPIC